MIDHARLFLGKAKESLDGAESELASGRYNNCANRSYYACYQAAVFALTVAGIQPSRRSGEWDHAFVQAQFARELINRRKRYPAELREVLARTMRLRHTADYELDWITRIQAVRALRTSQQFIAAIEASAPA
jgi:uncharacterized protein (UPF0332 family)